MRNLFATLLFAGALAGCSDWNLLSSTHGFDGGGGDGLDAAILGDFGIAREADSFPDLALAATADLDPGVSDAAPDDSQPPDALQTRDLAAAIDLATGFADGDLGIPDFAMVAMPDAATPDLSVSDRAMPDLAPAPDLVGADLAILATPCGDTAGLQKGAPWPMFRYCPTHQGRSPFLGAQQPKNRWSFATNSNVASSPAIGADGTVYIGSDDSNVYALDGATGKQKWIFATQGGVESSPAIGADGTIYIESGSGKVYALDGATGKQKWLFLPPNQPDGYASPAIGGDGTVFVGSGTGVYALDGVTGMKKGGTNGGNESGSPAIGADGTVYVGFMEGNRVYAFDVIQGRAKWNFLTGGQVLSSPTIGMDGTVYIGSLDGNVYALNGATGMVNWFVAARSTSGSSPAFWAGTIYIGGADGVYALNAGTGMQKWFFPTNGKVESSPAIGADGTIYIGSMDQNVYAISGVTGKQKWFFPTGGGVHSSPAIGADGTIYVGSYDGNVYAIGP